MLKVFSDKGWSDLNYWIKQDKKIYKRIIKLIDDIEDGDPFKGLGKPELLKHNYKGYWSRRINDEHRLIYKISDFNDTEKELFIASLKGHYD